MADFESGGRTAQPADAVGGHVSDRRPWYSAFVVAVLTVMFGTQYLDRQLVVILAEPLKREFALSDAEVGLLTGLVFSIPYSIMLLPVGALVDRVSRKRLLTVALTIWSGLTFLTGFARNLVELMAARSIIAAAESSNNPAALSLLADHYGPRNRATAIGIFYAGPGIASIIGFMAIGAVAAEFGWRAAFFTAGVPGLLLALVMAFAIKEPPRERLGGAKDGAGVPGVRESLRFIRSQKSLVHMMVGLMLTSAAISGQIAWVSPYLIRVHGLSLLEASIVISMAFGLANMTGHMTGGYIVDRLARRNIAWIGWAVAICAAMAGMAMMASALSTVLWVAVVGLALWALPSGCQYGPVMGAVQTLVNPRMRGFTTSCAQLLINLIGAGFGPLLIGGLSDRLEPALGTRSIAVAMAVAAAIPLWATIHFLLASRSIQTDLDRVNLDRDGVL